MRRYRRYGRFTSPDRRPGGADRHGCVGAPVLEAAGLLRAKERTESGYRVYGHEAATRLRFIKRAKALGFKLAEIKRLIDAPRAAREHERALFDHLLAAKLQETQCALRSCARCRGTFAASSRRWMRGRRRRRATSATARAGCLPNSYWQSHNGGGEGSRQSAPRPVTVAFGGAILRGSPGQAPTEPTGASPALSAWSAGAAAPRSPCGGRA